MNYGDMFITAGSEVFRDAAFSDCLRYRYTLTRSWDADKPMALFVMLNPSTADAAKDDPTIRRCISFAKSWGMGGLVVVNLFAFRATDPAELLTADDAIGSDNNGWIRTALQMCRGPIVAAWGTHKAIGKRADAVRKLIGHRDVMCLAKSKGGHPRHPLYLKGDLRPIVLWPASGSFEAEVTAMAEAELAGPLVASLTPDAGELKGGE